MVDEELEASVRARVGTSIANGRYRIEHILGIGGMAAVYAGSHRNGRRVAIKLLHPELSRRADIRRRFIREGQAANAVDHPGVVAVIDDDLTDEGAVFLVMERLEGKTLETLWAELGGTLPSASVLAFGRELCSVLAAAHRAGIVHRDIKPENLFLTNDGKFKVLDFGLAQLRDATRPKETHTGMVFGTPAFMPPEQANGRIRELDARTDIWAVGATMFTLLSGKMVHEGETAQHFVILAATQPARSLRTVLPNAHPAIVAIVDRALSLETARRWQSADAMLEAIRIASDAIFGEPDIPVPTVAQLLNNDRRADPTESGTPTEPDPPKMIGDAEEDDKTKVDQPRFDTDSSSPPTEPRKQIPRVPAIEREPSSRAASHEYVKHEAVVASLEPLESTAILETLVRPRSIPKARAADRPMPSPLVGAAQVRPTRPNTRTIATTRSKPWGRLAIVVGAAIVGLSPLIVFLARGKQEPSPLIEPASVAPTVSLMRAEPEVSSSPSSVPALAVPATPTTTEAAPPPSPVRSAAPPISSAQCTPPFTLDDRGIKRWKVGCFGTPRTLPSNPYDTRY